MTKILYLLIFSLFVFNLVEQTVLLFGQSHHSIMQSSSNDPVEYDNLISEDSDTSQGEALISTAFTFQHLAITGKVTSAIVYRLLFPINREHWKPPKQPLI